MASSSSAFISGVKATASASLGLIPFAIALGAMAVGSGLSALEALGLSVFVLSGAAQMAMIELISTGASVAVVVLTVIVISLRLTMYSASLAPHFRRLSAGWKGLLSYLLTDPAYAVTITRFDGGETREPNKRWYFLGAALVVWVTWQVSTVVGVFLGARVPEGLSLDFFLSLGFIALVLPAIKDRATTAAALSAGAVAAFAAALPLNLGLITAALAGVLGGLLAEGLVERREMSTFMLWLTIVVTGVVALALRLSFIALLGRIEMPRLLGRALRFVPAAALTALVIPSLFYEDDALQVALGNERLLAGLVAALIAWRTRSVLFTLGAGMVALWTLQAIEQSL